MKTTLPSGRASICQWELTLKFYIKEQVASIIKEMLDDYIWIDFDYYEVLEESRTAYCLDVSSSWANNIIAIGEIAKKYDHKMD